MTDQPMAGQLIVDSTLIYYNTCSTVQCGVLCDRGGLPLGNTKPLLCTFTMAMVDINANKMASEVETGFASATRTHKGVEHRHRLVGL